jgi:hypothetical protein
VAKPVAIFIADVIVSPGNKAHVATKHGIDTDDVRSATIGVAGLRGTWRNHPSRGWQLVLPIKLSDKLVAVILYEVDDPMGNVYRLGTVHPR